MYFNCMKEMLKNEQSIIFFCMDYPLKMLIHHFFLFIHKSALFFMNTMTLHVCSVRDFKMWSMEASTWLILSHYGLVYLLLIK